jgi:hypothetical protein
LCGLLVFFALFDWADIIAMSCAMVDPQGEAYYECDVDASPEERVYTTRAHLERWARDVESG